MKLRWLGFFALGAAYVLIALLLQEAGQPAQSWAVRNEDTGLTYTSIQAAIDAVETVAGQTILVNSASYDSSVEPGGCQSLDQTCLIRIHKPIGLRSSGGAAVTVLDAAVYQIILLIAAERVAIEGFTFTDEAARPQVLGIGALPTADVTDLVIRRNIFSDIFEALHIVGISSGMITENVVQNAELGIGTPLSKDTLIANNQIQVRTGRAIETFGGSGQQVLANELLGGAIFVNSSTQALVEGNVLRNGMIELRGSQASVVRGNYLSSSGVANEGISYQYGLKLEDSQGITAEGNWVQEGLGAGFFVEATTASRIANNTLSQNHVGLLVREGASLEIANNRIQDNAWGVKLLSTSGSTLADNVFDDNGTHVTLEQVSSSFLSGNIFDGALEASVELKESTTNVIEDNAFAGGEDGMVLRASTTNRIESNAFTGQTAAAVKLAASAETMIRQNTIEGAVQGIRLERDSDDNTLIENRLRRLQQGLILQQSEGNQLTGNTVEDIAEEAILLVRAEGNLLRGNLVRTSTVGISVNQGSDNVVENNELQENGIGILLTNAPENTVQGNRFSGNGNDRVMTTFPEDELLVRFHKGVPVAVIDALIRSLNTAVIPPFPLERLYHLRILDGQDLRDKIDAFNRQPEVELAEVNLFLKLFTQNVPNDPNFVNGLQWNLEAIGVSQAWEGGVQEATGVVVGLIDTGVDADHPDLADNIGGLETSNESLDPSIDLSGHGTFMAGIIAAQGNNGVANAGIVWRGHVHIFKISDEADWVDTARFEVALHQLLDLHRSGHRFSVVNFSGGGPNCNIVASIFGCSQILKDSLLEVQDEGILFVTAAGNDGKNVDEEPVYPCSYDLDNILCVSATDAEGKLAAFSNYGPVSADLAAPGQHVLSLLATDHQGQLPMEPQDTLSAYASGTSVAAAHVTGMAALFYAITPQADYAQIKALILEAVKPSAELAGKVAAGGLLYWPDTLP